MTPQEFFNSIFGEYSRYAIARQVEEIKATNTIPMLRLFVEEFEAIYYMWPLTERSRLYQEAIKEYEEEIERLNNMLFLGMPQWRYDELLPTKPTFLGIPEPQIPDNITFAINELKKGLSDPITDLVIAPSTGATPTTGGTAPEGWRLPMELDTERARKYFARAIERGFILPTSTGFKWIREARKGQGVNSLIALLGGMIYCGDEIVNSRYGDKWKLGDGGIFPDEELKQLFGVKSLGAIRTNGLDSSRQKTAPRGWREIVELFED